VERRGPESGPDDRRKNARPQVFRPDARRADPAPSSGSGDRP